MTGKQKDAAGAVIRAAVAMLLFVIAVVHYDTLSQLDVEQLLSALDNTAVMTAVVLLMYLVKGLIFVLPASVVYVAVGAVLESWLAVAVNLIGIALEVTVTYFLGRFLGGDAVRKMLEKKKGGRKILEKNLQDKKSLIFTTRLLPVFPIDFISLFFGASQSSFPLYFLLSVAGIAPRVVLFTIIGDNIFKWIPMDKLILLVIGCIPVGVLIYLVKKFVWDKKKKDKAKEPKSF